MQFDILHDGHELASKPLGEINAHMRNKQSTIWRSVKDWRHIGKASFLSLRGPWKELNEFGVQK